VKWSFAEAYEILTYEPELAYKTERTIIKKNQKEIVPKPVIYAHLKSVYASIAVVCLAVISGLTFGAVSKEF
jgi:hypothetical protein